MGLMYYSGKHWKNTFMTSVILDENSQIVFINLYDSGNTTLLINYRIPIYCRIIKKKKIKGLEIIFR